MAGKQVTELDALPSFTDNSLLPVHNGAGLKKGLLSQLANYLGTKFSNPNLLINPDFKINQRGQSTYSSTGAGATVDRWIGTNVKTVVNSDGTVSVSSLSGTGYYTQLEENISYGKHTYSIYVQAITGTVKAFYKSKDSKDIELGTLKQGLNTFTSVDDGFKGFFLSIAGGSSVTLKYAKIEQGTVATSFIAPNQAEEYLKCERFYQRVSLDLNPISLTNSQGFAPLNLETALRSTPTVSYWTNKIAVKKTYIDMTVEMLQFNKAWMSGSNVLAFQFTTSNNRISLIINNGQGIGDIALDAEIY